MRRGPPNETIAVVAADVDPQGRPATLPFARGVADGAVGGVPCVRLGRVPLAMDTLPWRLGPTLRLSVVVKARFSFDLRLAAGAAPAVPVPAAEAPRFFAADAHARNQPMAHVTSPSDRVPWKKSVDVTLLGHAKAQGGRPVAEMNLGFAAREGSALLFQKRARVIGKRASAAAPPEPFTSMPVVYERAFGGASTPTNPIGIGDDEDDPPPNLVDPVDPRRPAAFGPTAAGWPWRHRKLGGVKKPELDQPIMALPQGFDVTYFQSAPPDQQIATLGPGASFVLEGFDAERPRVELALPRAQLVGAIWGLVPADPNTPTMLGFRLDTVQLDADSWSCVLVFRGYVDLPDPAVLTRLIVAAGLSLDGEGVPLPAHRPAPEGAVAAGGLRAAPTRVATGTLEIGSAAEAAAPLPFQAPLELGATLALTPGAARELLPFVAPPPAGLARSAPAPSPPAVGAPLPAPPARVVPSPEPPAAAAPPVAPVDSAPPSAPRVETVADAPATPPPPPPPPPPVAAPPAPPRADPYGQAAPWARGAEPGTGAAAIPDKPKARVERKFNLRAGFRRS